MPKIKTFPASTPQGRVAKRMDYRPQGTAQGREGANAAQRRTGAAAAGTAVGSRSKRNTASRRMKGKHPWLISFEDARNSSSTISCLGPAIPPAVRLARRRPTASTGFSRT